MKQFQQLSLDYLHEHTGCTHHGGEITGTIDESIRHAITKLSHIHFVSNKNSKDRVIKLGENPKLVFNVGCPRIDEIKKNIKKI